MSKSENGAIVLQAAAATESLPCRRAKLTVYFDGSCPLCSAEIDHYASRKGGDMLAFVDVSAPGFDPDPDLSRQEAMRRFHVRHSDGAIESGAAAFIALWDQLPGWKPIARLASLPLLGPVLEVAYRLFLPFRPMISRLYGGMAARRASRARNG